jgi:glucokinase
LAVRRPDPHRKRDHRATQRGRAGGGSGAVLRAAAAERNLNPDRRWRVSTPRVLDEAGIAAKREGSILARHVLLGDIGATNARFALLANGALGPVKSFDVAGFARFADAAAIFLKDHCQKIEITNAVLAVAGPIEGERCVLTNCSWVIDARELHDTFRLEARIVNDFAAMAFSLPSLTSADLVEMGSGKAELGAPTAVLGPGSGLGVACLVPGLGKPVVIPSEGGHATLAGMCDREDKIIKQLRRRFGHVSAERTVSGDGLENIYQAIVALDGLTLAPRSAADITKRALSGDCQIAREALAKFCAFLGSFAGNVALTFGARGGVYIAGGILPRIVDFMARSEFRNRFEAKGRLRPYLETIPSYVIVHPAAAFLGLKSLSAH